MDNYYQSERRSWDRAYLHRQSGHWIYLGDVQAAQNLNFIHSHGIATVVTAALGMDHLDYSEVAVRHILYPLLDHQHHRLPLLFDDFYNIIDRHVRLGNLLLHCAYGLSSSPALLVAYLMKKEGSSYGQALDQVRQSRPRVRPNLAIQRQLRLYERHLREQQNPLAFTRHSGCHSSINKRTVSLIKYQELPSFSNTIVASSKAEAKRGSFQVRNMRRRSIDPKWRPPSSFCGLEEGDRGEGSGLLNFEVVKVDIRERVAVKSRMRQRGVSSK